MAHLILLAVFLVSPPQEQEVAGEAELLEQSREQAEYYIRNVRDRANTPENLWALSALWESNGEIRAYISRAVGGGDENGLLEIFTDTTRTYGGLLREAAFRLESPQLLMGYLLDEKDSLRRRNTFEAFNFREEEESGIRYETLLDHMLRGKRIDEEILPADQIGLPHFFLFYYSRGRSIMPEEYITRIAEIPVRNNGTSTQLTGILSRLPVFQAQYFTDQYARTLENYNLLSRDERLPNSRFKFDLYRFLVYSMYQIGYPDRSLEIVRNFTLPLSHYLERRSLQLTINLTRAIYLYEIGKIEAAQEVYQEVLAEAEERNILEAYLSVLFNNLAVTYVNMGNYDQYLNLQFRALEIADSTGQYAHQFTILKNLFVYYRDNQDAESALLYIDRARELAQSENRPDDLAELNLLTGTFYKNMQQDYERAETYFARADDQLSADENYASYEKLKFEQADLRERQGAYDRAVEIYDHIIEAAEEHNNRQNIIESHIKKAKLHLSRGNTRAAGRAIAFYKREDLNTLRFDQLVQARSAEAEHLLQTGNPSEAYEILDPLIDQIIEWARGSTDLQSGFWNVEPEFLEAFRLTANLLIDTGRKAEAVRILDQLKSINDASLYQNPLVRSSILTESELSQYKRLTDRLNRMRRQLLAAGEDNRGELHQRIDELTAQKRVFDRKLSSETDFTPFPVSRVQSRLDARERVLHVTELDDRYYLAAISRTGIDVRTVSLDSVNRDLFETAVRQVAGQNTDLDLLHRIYGLLGLEELPGRVNRITVIPDSYLYQLPLGILPVREPQQTYSYGNARYLVEEMEVRYLTSLNDYRQDERPRAAHEVDFAGYGISTFEEYADEGLVPLPFARREVRNIRAALGNLKVRDTYFGPGLTEEVFKSTAPSARILHLATHSQVSEQDPLFSRFFMSQGKEGTGQEQFPGQVFAYELFELDLSSELIMLNSCESGSGRYLQGSGVMGFSRALRYAGARSLLLNLWSVNDMMASEFAEVFYRAVNKGKSKSEALRSAKLHFLKNKNADPHFWGPYMLIGDNEPLVKPYETWNRVVAGAFMLCFLLFTGGSLYYRGNFRRGNKG